MNIFIFLSFFEKRIFLLCFLLSLSSVNFFCNFEWTHRCNAMTILTSWSSSSSLLEVSRSVTKWFTLFSIRITKWNITMNVDFSIGIIIKHKRFEGETGFTILSIFMNNQWFISIYFIIITTETINERILKCICWIVSKNILKSVPIFLFKKSINRLNFGVFEALQSQLLRF